MIKEHRIIREVRRLAAENPDFVYKPPKKLYPNGEWAEGDTCQYVHEGRGSCLFGQAMMNTGDLTAETAKAFEGQGIGEVLCKLRLGLSGEEMDWAAAVQGAQDSGNYTWSDAVALADCEYGAAK